MNPQTEPRARVVTAYYAMLPDQIYTPKTLAEQTGLRIDHARFALQTLVEMGDVNELGEDRYVAKQLKLPLDVEFSDMRCQRESVNAHKEKMLDRLLKLAKQY